MEIPAAMKVSVVIPLFNKAPYLAACINSVLAQLEPDMEVLVVDDASTDEGPELIARMVDPRLRLIRLEQNRGPGMAAQVGMDEARGTYILRMDADDVMHADRIAHQIAWMEQQPTVDIAGGAMDLIGRSDIQRRSPEQHADCAAQLLFGVGLFQPTMCVRRVALERSGLRYRAEWPRYGEDRLYQVEAALRGLKLGNTGRVLVHYREGPQNTVNRVDRASATTALDEAVLAALGHAQLTPATATIHAMASKRFAAPLSAAQIAAFRSWLDHLVEWSRDVPVLDAPAVERRCSKAWDELFHHLPFHDLATCRAYLAAGGQLTPGRIYYAFRKWMSGPDPSR